MTDPSSRLMTRAFVFLIIGHFLQALGYSSMLILPLYLDHLGASYAQIGGIMAVASIGGLACRPLVGWALDRIGRKPVVVIGTLFLATSMGLIYFVRDLGILIYVVRIIFGIGIGALFTGYFTFATDLIPPSRRTEGLALFGISGLIPLVINPLTGELGISGPDLAWFYPLLGGIILTSLLAVAPVPEPERTPPPEPVTVKNVFQYLSNRRLAPVWLATIVFAGLVAMFMVFVAVVAKRRGLGNPAGFWLTYAACAIFVRAFGARLPDRLGTHNLVAPALAVMAIGALIAAGAWNNTAFLVAGAFSGLGHGYCFPVLSSQVASRIPEHLRGAGFAMFTALWEVSALIFKPLFGALADGFSDGVMFASGALMAVVGLAAWVVVEHRANLDETPLLQQQAGVAAGRTENVNL